MRNKAMQYRAGEHYWQERKTDVRVIDADARTVEFTTSTQDIDRHRTILKDFELDNYRANPSVLWAHKGDVWPVGRTRVIGMDSRKRLRSRVEFTPSDLNDFGFRTFKLVEADFIRGVSVGFIPGKVDFIEGRKSAEGKGKGTPPHWILSSNDLIEQSLTPIPSNPNALKKCVRDGLIRSDELSMFTVNHIEPAPWMVDAGLERVAGILDEWTRSSECELYLPEDFDRDEVDSIRISGKTFDEAFTKACKAIDQPELAERTGDDRFEAFSNGNVCSAFAEAIDMKGQHIISLDVDDDGLICVGFGDSRTSTGSELTFKDFKLAVESLQPNESEWDVALREAGETEGGDDAANESDATNGNDDGAADSSSDDDGSEGDTGSDADGDATEGDNAPAEGADDADNLTPEQQVNALLGLARMGIVMDAANKADITLERIINSAYESGVAVGRSQAVSEEVVTDNIMKALREAGVLNEGTSDDDATDNNEIDLDALAEKVAEILPDKTRRSVARSLFNRNHENGSSSASVLDEDLSAIADSLDEGSSSQAK